MRNRGRRRSHSAQDSSLPRPNGPGPHGPGPHARRDYRGSQRAPARTQGEIIFGVEPVRELLAASPNSIQTLYVKNGLYERFGGEIETVREAVKSHGCWIVALAPHGDTSLYELGVSRRLGIVLGSEDRGVRELVKHNSDFVVSIPMHGRIASLNVPAAAAITLFEIARRRP